MIDPNAISTIRVDQLAAADFNLTDNIPHEVGQVLKRGTVQQLADLIAAQIETSGGVGYLPISVTDGQQLPDVRTEASFFLCGKGTFLNINGYPSIVCTEELNAIMSVTDHWEIAVEIPIEVNPEAIGIAQTINEGVLDSAPSQDAVYQAIHRFLNAVGSFHYADEATQTTPISVTSGVETLLTNDALGEYTSITNAPYGVPTVWDAVNNEFDFSSLSIGDLVHIRPDLLIDLVGTNTSYEIYMKLAIGTASEWILDLSTSERKSTSEFKKNAFIGFDIENEDTRTAPAQIFIKTDANATVKVNGWYVEVLRKNINIVDIVANYIPDVDASLRFYNDGINNVIGSNVSSFKTSVIWNTGDSTTFILPFIPTNLIGIFINGLKLYKSSQFNLILPNQIEILQDLEDEDVIDFIYEHYNETP
jgi:hypothetical protein